MTTPLPRIAQSPTDPNFVQDPYPFYDRARDMGPLVHWEEMDRPIATTYAAINAILRDRRFGREIPAELAPDIPPHQAPFYAVEAHSMLELEPPRHTRLRSLVLRAFTSRRIAALGPEIRVLSNDLLDRVRPDAFDLLPAYATQIPVIIIARLLGVPESMADTLLRWSNAMVSMYQARRTRDIELAAATATREFSDFMRDYVDQRRARPADDLITHLIAAESEGEKLSTDELISTCILLLNAGHEATVHTIGNGVKTILEQGVPTGCLAPETIPSTIEEVLRFDPPLHKFTRHAYTDIDLLGHRFQRGDQVDLLLAAAGRDPAAYANPGQFDPRRTGPGNLSFGGGIHFCVGAPLARLELQIAIATLFQRFPDLRLRTAPRYGNVYPFHGLESLPVGS